LLQSICSGVGGPADLHDGSLGFVVQSTGGPPGVGSGPGALVHSGEVDPCSHVVGGGGKVVPGGGGGTTPPIGGVGSPISGGVGVGG
jgi:hypothetical protein